MPTPSDESIQGTISAPFPPASAASSHPGAPVKQEKRAGRKPKQQPTHHQVPTTTTPHNDEADMDGYDTDDFTRAIEDLNTVISQAQSKQRVFQAAFDKYKKKKNKAAGKQQVVICYVVYREYFVNLYLNKCFDLTVTHKLSILITDFLC